MEAHFLIKAFLIKSVYAEATKLILSLCPLLAFKILIKFLTTIFRKEMFDVVASWIRFCFALYYWVWCLLWDLYIDLESWNSWKEITFSKLKSKDIWKMQEILRKTHTIGCFFSKLHSETSLKEGNMKGNFFGYDTSKNPISWLDNRSLKT